MHEPKYCRLTRRDRFFIAKLQKEKRTPTEIALRIGKHKSTVSRELRRNADRLCVYSSMYKHWLKQGWSDEELHEHLRQQPEGAEQFELVWRPWSAQTMAADRAREAAQKRRRKKPETRAWVIAKLHLDWSPEQIAGRSKSEGPESVSHEYVYALVHREKKAGRNLHHQLRRFGRRKQRLGHRSYPRTVVPSDRVSIEQRPAIVARRSRLGDCEADLIVGYRQSGYILTVIDRKSRKLVLRRLNSKRMSEVRAQLKIAFKKLGIVHTLTVDNGKEFYAHKELTEDVGVRVYFTHPYCSTERGSIENANGLVRYYLPKRTSFDELEQRHLDLIEQRLNSRPRQCLGYLTPDEAHSKTASLRTS